MKLLLYCTKAKPYLIRFGNEYGYNQFDTSYCKEEHISPYEYGTEILNGKIVAECDFDIDKIEYKHIKERDKFGILHNEAWYEYKGLNITNEDCDLLSKSNLTDDEVWDYLINKNGYAIHIKNLHIFNKPKELSEYYSIIDMGGGMLGTKPLTKAPQNMMKVSVNHWDYATYEPNDINILISIRSEWLCKILNEEKTIEVRKKVLKEML